jgi:hypothetical protein
MYQEVNAKDDYYIIQITRMCIVGSHLQSRETEKEREICAKCMAKLRPNLDVIDGKTDSTDQIVADIIQPPDRVRGDE